MFSFFFFMRTHSFPMSTVRYEKTESEFVTKLPPGKHSTKGVGRTCPDPTENKVLESGLIVPAGRGVPAPVTHTSLLYNEYPCIFAWGRICCALLCMPYSWGIWW